MTTITNHLIARRSEILDRWFALILDSYPEQSSKFMREEKDRFLNPVGFAIRHDIEAIFDLLVQQQLDLRAIQFPEDMIKIRALQNFQPSQAVSFVFLLKRILPEPGGGDLDTGEREAIDSRIDQLALMAFDVYMNCRESIFQIRVGEIQKKRLGLEADYGI